MSTRTKRLLFWTPRIIGMLFGLFLSLFALDVFGVGLSFWESIRAFLIHLAPVYVVFIVLACLALGMGGRGLLCRPWVSCTSSGPGGTSIGPLTCSSPARFSCWRRCSC